MHTLKYFEYVFSRNNLIQFLLSMQIVQYKLIIEDIENIESKV